MIFLFFLSTIGWLCIFHIEDISQFIDDMGRTWEKYEKMED